jgi:polysaccharide chain length determinant protein (PEP-CTERM system associated)
VASDIPEYDERPARDFLEYLEIPFRYPRHFLVPLVACLAVGVALAVWAPRKYRSGTLIIVETKTVPSDYFVSAASAESMRQRLNTMRQVALSRNRLEEIIKRLDPYPGTSDQPLHVVTERMRDAIQIRVHGSDSFMFEYVNRYPYKAMVVTNMLAAQFIEDSDRIRDDLNRRALELLRRNVAETRTALEQREAEIGRYEQENWESLPDRQDANLKTIAQLQAEQQTLAEYLRTLEQRREALERGVLEGRRQSGAPPPPALELANLRSTYESMRGRYTDEYPDMASMRARMQLLQEQLAAQAERAQSAVPEHPSNEELRRALAPVEAEIEGLRQRREALDARIEHFHARIEDAPRARKGLTDLTRDYSLLREDYTAALRREREAEMARKIEEFWRTGYFRVIDPAYLPGRPIMPYTTLFLLGGLGIGLAAGLLAAVVADTFDRSVKSERELQEVLPYPLLVTLPRAEAAAEAEAPGAGSAG